MLDTYKKVREKVNPVCSLPVLGTAHLWLVRDPFWCTPYAWHWPEWLEIVPDLLQQSLDVANTSTNFCIRKKSYPRLEDTDDRKSNCAESKSVFLRHMKTTPYGVTGRYMKSIFTSIRMITKSSHLNPWKTFGFGGGFVRKTSKNFLLCWLLPQNAWQWH